MHQPEGIDVDAVTGWFEQNAPGVQLPLSFVRIPSGRSNLTFVVTDADGRRWVLRRPPLGQVLATAHDMGREHRIISALGPTDVPVPPVIGFSPDDDVNGAPFYVMEYVDGLVLREKSDAEEINEAARARAGLSLAETLARIHAVEPAAVGLGQLGKTEGYIARQLKRWHGQWQQSKTRELPIIDDVHDALAARIPKQGPAAIVHGDYRLDNCIVDRSGEVIAVLDWELCTLGDPLADVGLLLVYWTEPGDEHSALLSAPTLAKGFASRKEVVERYAERSGRNVDDVGFYIAFGYWKLACILEGVFARYAGGAMGQASGFEGFAIQVERLAQSAATTVEAL